MCREEMAKNVRDLGIRCTVILDSAVGYVMEQVDMVMIGAEGVVESGGIINKVPDLRNLDNNLLKLLLL